MNDKALHNLSYGLFVLSAKDGEKDNGCIINTAIQAAFSPTQISICVNKANYTHDMIMNTGKFTISVLSKKADFKLYELFGLKSGQHLNKFVLFQDRRRGENGLYYLTKGANAYISGQVIKSEDIGSHTLFIAEVTAMEVLNDEPSATYDYYLKKVKPKPKKECKKKKNEKTIWRCRICGYEYEGEELPEDFICPVCKHPASDFEKVTTTE